MAFVLKDRVRETSDTVGSGAIHVTGVVNGGYQTFNGVLSNGDTTLCLCRNDAGEWQSFLGTWVSATQSLTRTTVYDGSSGAGVTVGFSGEAQEVWIDYPAQAYHAPQFQTATIGNHLANYWTVAGSANTGVFDTSAPTMQAAGTGTNIDLKVLGKGTGRLNTTRMYVGVTTDRAGANDSSTIVWKMRPNYTGAGYPVWRAGGAYTGTWGSSGEGGTFNGVYADNDTVDATSSGGPGLLSLFDVSHAVGAGATGGRVALSSFLNIGGAITAGVGAGSFLLASAFFAQASASAGGTAGAGNSRGNLFGTNISSRLVNSAGLYWNSVIGGEINYGTPTGTASIYKVGLQLVQWGDDAVAGLAGTDTAISIISQTDAAVIGLDIGLTFGHSLGWWALKPTGTLIGTTVSNIAGSPRAYEAAYGVDWRGVTLSAGAFASTGFLVNGSGTTTTSGRILAVRIHTASVTMATLTATDDVLVVNRDGAGAATTVALPAGITGRRYIVKDGKGDAAANNITITSATGNIDGAANLVISSNYGYAVVQYNGTQWNRIG